MWLMMVWKFRPSGVVATGRDDVRRGHLLDHMLAENPGYQSSVRVLTK